jgi:group II intron reverse transcriptase/maturase
VGTESKPQKQAMYVATTADKEWLLIEQRKLYQRSGKHPDYIFRKIWGLITDPRNLRVALVRVSRNKGRRTAGIDGKTVRSVLNHEGAEAFVDQLRICLRQGAFTPSAVRRVLIPKGSQPGKFRALGIPTVIDRVVQAALKNILEPIFEPDFYPISFGFRPGKSAHAALEYIRILLRPKAVGPKAERRLPYQWVVEGDIKGCFDNIDHHALMNSIRRRIGDNKVLRLILAFLKAGILSEKQFLRTETGTPQGGILSPLLSNIALSAIEEKYERHVWPRRTPTPLLDEAAIKQRASGARNYDRRLGRCVLMPVRYADDFLVFVSVPPGPDQDARAERIAHAEKAEIAGALAKDWTLELSETKTLITRVTEPVLFLGHHVRVRTHPSNRRLVSTAVIPKERSHRLRERIKALFHSSSVRSSLADRLRLLNPILRGWCNYYRYAWGAKSVFDAIDSYVWWTILRWIRKKHAHAPMKFLRKRYGWNLPGCSGLRWGDGDVRPFELWRTRVQHFKLGWLKPPAFAITDGEPGA